MAMSIGDATASSGMANAIYVQLNQLLSPKIPPEALAQAQEGWKQLAFAIASGVISHILANMEVTGVRATASATLAVSGGNATGTVSSTQTAPTTNLIR